MLTNAQGGNHGNLRNISDVVAAYFARKIVIWAVVKIARSHNIDNYDDLPSHVKSLMPLLIIVVTALLLFIVGALAVAAK